jgi:hypothetical protein
VKTTIQKKVKDKRYVKYEFFHLLKCEFKLPVNLGIPPSLPPKKNFPVQTKVSGLQKEGL